MRPVNFAWRMARIASSASFGLSSTSRISIVIPGENRSASCNSFRARVSVRQAEVERRALTRGAFGPDGSRVTLQHALDNGESHARAAELRVGMQALEDSKQPVTVAHVEAHTVVPHEINRADRVDGRAHGDAWGGLRSRELARVADKVRPHLLQHLRVAKGIGQRVDGDLDLGIGIGELRGDVLGEPRHVHGYAANVQPAETRIVEKAVDEAIHLAHVAANLATTRGPLGRLV